MYYKNLLKQKRSIDTLQATLCGQTWPKPSGGEIFLNNTTTSRLSAHPLNKST